MVLALALLSISSALHHRGFVRAGAIEPVVLSSNPNASINLPKIPVKKKEIGLFLRPDLGRKLMSCTRHLKLTAEPLH